MDDYISVQTAAKKWKVTPRWVNDYCNNGRIPGAKRWEGKKDWLIPKNTKKPVDARTKTAKAKSSEAKPFLKWAGGKGQLLTEIGKYYPFAEKKHIKKYAEPFVGGGAVLFDVLNKHTVDEVYISDINAELINTYITIRDNSDELISRLKTMESDYLAKDADARKKAYLEARARFNALKRDSIRDAEAASLMIFLNRTCFNGLYRVNKAGDYNVPMGAYKNPQICNEDNLLNVSKKLQNANIVCGDYKDSASFIDDKTFVYFDPPYRPLTKTANFTSYTEQLFDDNKQLELANFVQDLDNKGALIVISNSDPKNTDENDNFFDDAYSKQNIRRVAANRMINRNSDARGKINELLIANF